MEEFIHEVIEAICGHLSDRNAVLFLGAGINYGTLNDEGESFPLGATLGNWICRDLIQEEGLTLPLVDAVEIADHREGRKTVNDYIYSKFKTFKPNTAHLALVQLPWDIIYTTNYDLLVEEASVNTSINVAGTIRSIYDKSADLSAFSERDILYYKIHGTMDFANKEEGRLILTREDYRHYEIHRKPLFKRLERDLLNRTFVFIGYSLEDSNFREILDDCRNQLGTKTFPLSYAIKKGFKRSEEIFWKDKYNIQLIDIDGATFLDSLKTSWLSENRIVSSFEEIQARNYTTIDSSTRFPKIGDSYYQLNIDNITGKSDPLAFFKGAEPNWADIKEKIAPHRDKHDPLSESLFQDVLNINNPSSLYLVTGSAGTGKTTLIKSIVFELNNYLEVPIYFHIPNTPIDINILESTLDYENPKRIILVIKNAGLYVKRIEIAHNEIRRKKLPITLLLEERRNQWNVGLINNNIKDLSPAEFELGRLSPNEISLILEALRKYHSLGKLTGLDKEYQEKHFAKVAHKDLLVALREITTGTSFDEIIKNEYDNIPSSLGKSAYVYVSALGQMGLSLRYTNLARILGIDLAQLKSQVFQPTDSVLISGEDVGSSRHDIGYKLTTRHPVIASVIFSYAASNDDEKHSIINNIIEQLDPGFQDDNRILEQIIKRKELVNTLLDSDKKRAIYDKLEIILPNNPYVLQHRSILEKDLGYAEAAIAYATRSIEIGGNKPLFKNTLGLALEFSARNTRDELAKSKLIHEAEKIFNDGLKKDPSDPYSYIGKYYILKNKIENSSSEREKKAFQINALSLLEEALEATNDSTIIAASLGEFHINFGDTDEAVLTLTNALTEKPFDNRIRNLLIKSILEQKPQLEENIHKAISIAQEGIRQDTTSWRLQRDMARLQIITKGDFDSINGYYEAAIRHNKGDLSLSVEYASFLFKRNEYKKANKIFKELIESNKPAEQKKRIKDKWLEGDESKIFNGKVINLSSYTGTIIAIPENFEVFFWRTNQMTLNLKLNQDIKFTVAFNSYGPLVDRFI
ncbi:SIR2 family protein [Siphonobacter sp. SORGH_AS_0500]|uniref:SIR2 family protein n=1 Tax=Siphonobacter sp. SORGH_AS_0500 TaxID=1864824 RepID=UPI00285D9EBE|nr:SIR2 family protein [Siphonobacter sp. SORGH_AS_0500]MDR6195676.1 tetratricopeptide (TPR) repeat protein [Siphonobacter sp. SORGH_AS_0500]